MNNTERLISLKHKLNFNLNENSLVFGDCKDWLPFIPDNSVDLIYIDPPFFSQKNYEIIWGNGFEKRSFTDRWRGGKEHYLLWMRERLIEAKRILKSTGSIFLHCDYRANYRLRMLLDEILGEKNFKNEIVWCFTSGGASSKYFSHKHQTIFFYTKNKRKFKMKLEKSEKRYLGKKGYNNSLKILKDEKHCCLGPHTFNYPKDWWDEIGMLSTNTFERIGYDTQKPEALIRKILKCVTKKNQTVLDFFGGGGTTAKVAHDLGRKFITGDVSPVAYRVMIDRLNEAGASFKKVNPPLTRTEWLKINDKEFEKKICMFQGWVHNPTSKPVDGWVDKTKQIPVEIKNHTGQTGVGDIRRLAGAMAMAGQTQGVFVSWHYSKGCYEYVAQLEKKGKQKIELVFAHTIIGDLVLTKAKREEYQALYGERVKASKKRARIIEKAG